MPGTAKEVGNKNNLKELGVKIEKIHNNANDVNCNTNYGNQLILFARGKSNDELKLDDDRFDARRNIISGTLYLAEQLAKFKDKRLAIAAYNDGPGDVERKCPSGYASCNYDPESETGKYIRLVLDHEVQLSII